MIIENMELKKPGHRVVYELIDPRTGEPVYIGETNSPISRARYHCYDPGDESEMEPTQKWTKRLREQGIEPIMRLIISATPDSRVSRYFENIRIRQLKLQGVELLNRRDTTTDEMEAIIIEVGVDRPIEEMEPKLNALYIREYAPRSVRQRWMDKYGSLP